MALRFPPQGLGFSELWVRSSDQAWLRSQPLSTALAGWCLPHGYPAVQIGRGRTHGRY